MDRTAASLLAAVSHRRLRYVEHETVLAAAGPDGSLPHFTVFADFDVEAHSEDKAAELVDEVLDAVSSDALQYFSHGLVSGEQRVHRPQPAAEDDEQETNGAPPGGRGGRRRGGRGRGRGPRAETLAVSPTASQDPPADSGTEQDSPPSVVADDRAIEEIPLDTPPEELPVEPEVPPRPPSRSSASMQVKTTVTLRASELPANGDADELIALATTEARRRHPDLPGDAPASDVSLLPWGERLLTLSWSYDVPVPSAHNKD